jgi:hypothetical protein
VDFWIVRVDELLLVNNNIDLRLLEAKRNGETLEQDVVVHCIKGSTNVKEGQKGDLPKIDGTVKMRQFIKMSY